MCVYIAEGMHRWIIPGRGSVDVEGGREKSTSEQQVADVDAGLDHVNMFNDFLHQLNTLVIVLVLTHAEDLPNQCEVHPEIITCCINHQFLQH